MSDNDEALVLAAVEDILDAEAVAAFHADVLLHIQQLRRLRARAYTERLDPEERAFFVRWMSSENARIAELITRLREEDRTDD